MFTQRLLILLTLVAFTQAAQHEKCAAAEFVDPSTLKSSAEVCEGTCLIFFSISMIKKTKKMLPLPLTPQKIRFTVLPLCIMFLPRNINTQPSLLAPKQPWPKMRRLVLIQTLSEAIVEAKNFLTIFWAARAHQMTNLWRMVKPWPC